MNRQAFWGGGLAAVAIAAAGYGMWQRQRSTNLMAATAAANRRANDLRHQQNPLVVPRATFRAEPDPDEQRRNANQKQNIAARMRSLTAVADLEFGRRLLKLGWPPEKIRHWELLFTAEAMTDRDLTSAVFEYGLLSTNPEVQEMFRLAHEEARLEIVSQLGQTAYDQAQTMVRQQAAYDFASSVAGLLYASNDPITPMQSDALAGILAQSSKEYQKGSSVSLDDLNWAAAEAQARTVLSAFQMEAFENIKSDSLTRIRLSRAVRELNAQALAPKGPG